MRSLKYDGPWQFHMEDVPVPTPGANEVLVRSDAVGICGSDVHGFTGESGRRKAGMVMGHEAAGTVVALGTDVSNLKVGDSVVIFPTLGCGKCRFCQGGQEHICPDKKVMGVNAGTWGAMGEFFLCHERQAFAIPEKVDPAIGLFGEPIGVALHAVNLMKPAPDDILAIVGAGTIGLAVVLVLVEKGHKNIFIVDKIEEKLAFAKTLGAQPIHAEKENPLEVIAKATGGRRANGVFEAVGASATVKTAYDLCDFGGTVVLIGNLAKEFTLPLQGVTSNEVTLRGSYGFNRAEFAEGVKLAIANQKSVQHLISGSCSLEDTPGVMEKLAKGTLRATKIVIRPHDLMGAAA